MGLAQSLDPLGIKLDPGFAKKLIGKQPSAHADLAMNAPYGKLDTLRVERFLPREDMLIHAVYKRTVEIKQKDRLDALCTLCCQQHRLRHRRKLV